MKRSIVCLLLSLLMCNYVLAQMSNSCQEIEVELAIKQQCVNKVKTLMHHFAEIAKKDNPDSIKDYHIEACLDLFMGRGNDTKDDDGNIIIPAPRIEVSSLATVCVNSYFIKNYLTRLKMQHSKIVFRAVECYLPVGSIKKVGENMYLAEVFSHLFIVGNNDDQLVYREKQKKIQVLIEKDNLGRYEVLLGDIKVDQTDTNQE